jgi:hypothetical protein
MKQNGNNNPEALMQALVDPMSKIEQSMTQGVSRMALPLGGLLGSLGATVATNNRVAVKPAPLGLLSELLEAVHNLLQNLLSRGPIGNLLNDLLGSVLGGVTGTLGSAVGSVAGGGATGQVQDLLSGILSSTGALLPGAGAGATVGAGANVGAGAGAGTTNPVPK